MRRILAVLLCCGMAPGFAGALHGAGATFPYPLYARWAAQYRAQTGIDVDYDPVGSGAGIERVERGLVDFGASDMPLSPQDLQRNALQQFPAVIGGIVPIFNIAGIGSGELRLSGAVLADIYRGRIRKWNAPAITELNPRLHLPNSAITVVHRADASGSSFLWGRFLASASADWTVAVTATPDWPVGVAATGNEGVASSVQRTRMAIGYVEYAYAREHRLSMAAVQNLAGRFVRPGLDGFRAALEASQAASHEAGNAGEDWNTRLSNPPGENSWPITAASFVLLPAASAAGERRREVYRFFAWALRNGQPAALKLDYLPLPDVIVDDIMRRWADADRPPDAVAPAATPSAASPCTSRFSARAAPSAAQPRLRPDTAVRPGLQSGREPPGLLPHWPRAGPTIEPSRDPRAAPFPLPSAAS